MQHTSQLLIDVMDKAPQYRLSKPGLVSCAIHFQRFVHQFHALSSARANANDAASPHSTIPRGQDPNTHLYIHSITFCSEAHGMLKGTSRRQTVKFQDNDASRILPPLEIVMVGWAAQLQEKIALDPGHQRNGGPTAAVAWSQTFLL
jgi:hypothetical protein